MRKIVIFLLSAGLLAAGPFHKKKYADPITKDTKQPDKVLFDKAINDIEHGRFEVARITLNTLINTYDQSEFLAKAKLAIADSWYREGGAHGLAEAEAEYRDFILFYPTLPEAAESQMRICDIHYKQMDKADRDNTQELRAEAACRDLITNFPNSKYVEEAQTKVREVQEAIAQGEFMVGDYYHHRGANPAAANRLGRLVDQYPLFSGADEALWEMADSYEKMGGKNNRFKKEEIEAYTRIVRDYPLGARVDDAKRKLTALEAPVPDADPAALARMKYDQDHPVKHSMLSKAMDMMRRGPDVSKAARTGTPAMATIAPRAPISVPVQVPVTTTPEIVGTQAPADSKALDEKPDAREALGSQPGGVADGKTAANGVTLGAGPGAAPAAAGAASEGETQTVMQAPPVTNHPVQPKKKDKKKKKTTDTTQQAQPADPKATDTANPNPASK